MNKYLAVMVLSLGCAGDKDEPTDTDTNPADTDTDTDTDTDSDTDTDTDTDTGIEAASLAGDWSGTCSATLTGSTSSSIDGLQFDLSLDEDAGAVTGTALVNVLYGYTSSSTYALPLIVDGTLDGDVVELSFEYDYSSTYYSSSSSYDYSWPAIFAGTLDGGTLDGDLIVYPYGTYGYIPVEWPCELARQ